MTGGFASASHLKAPVWGGAPQTVVLGYLNGSGRKETQSALKTLTVTMEAQENGLSLIHQR